MEPDPPELPREAGKDRTAPGGDDPASAPPAPRGPGGARFLTTQWSVVLAARSPSERTASAALETLCRAYWYPLYAFARRQGNAPHDAEDLTQGFFAQLLEKDFLAAAREEKGRLRTFLLVAFKRHIGHERDRARAQKRGGGQVPVSIDQELAEERFHNEPSDGVDPEMLYERRWALTLIENVLEELRESYVQRGKEELFDTLKPFIAGGRGGPTYAEIGTRLGLTEAAVKIAVHRVRQRYRQLLREHVAGTVGSEADVDGEIGHLFAIFGG